MHELAVYPTIGIPIAYIYHDILLKIKVESPTSQPIFEISARQEPVQHLRHRAVCDKKDAGTFHLTPCGKQTAKVKLTLPILQPGMLGTGKHLNGPISAYACTEYVRYIGLRQHDKSVVEIHTWLSYNEVNACKIASMARGCTPFSGSSVTSTAGGLARYGKIVKARMRSVPSESPDDVTS